MRHRGGFPLLPLLALALLSAGGCRGAGARTEPSGGAGVLIVGTIRVPDRGHALAGRVIQAVNMDTGQSVRSTTNEAGGYEVSVAPGRYRVNVLLLPGESILTGPDVIDAAGREARVRADFLLVTSAPARPRPRPRQPTVLGAPSA